MIIHRFVSGLKYEIKKDVLRNTQISTLADAVLAAERAQATLDYLRSDNPKYFQKNKFHHNKSTKPRDESVPMELGNTRRVHNS